MAYVDGYVFPVPTKNLDRFAKMSRKAGKIWREYGALDYRECTLDDANAQGAIPFPKAFKVKPDETLMFSFILYKSRADRVRINKKVHADPRLAKMFDPKDPIFDWKKMVMGGFKVLVTA